MNSQILKDVKEWNYLHQLQMIKFAIDATDLMHSNLQQKMQQLTIGTAN